MQRDNGPTPAALLAGCLILAAEAAAAQQAASSIPLEEITVTARRSSELLRDAPASISVLTADTLDKAGVTTTEDLVQLTAGVTITTGDGDVGDTQINIRGLNGARDAENNVGLVVDGILKTNASQLNQVQGDLTQVEVLKGPQGAYYGRGAAAGAIVMTTRQPGETLSASATLGAGENATRYAQFGVDGPLGDSVGAALYADYRETDGFYRNTGPIAAVQGATVDRLERWSVSTRLLADPTPATELDFKARYGKQDAGALAYDVVFSLPGFAELLGSPLFNEDVNERDYAFLPNIASDNNQETLEASLKATIDLGWGELTAWTLYSDVEQDFIADSTLGGAGRLNAQPACIATTADLFNQGVTLPAPQALGPTPDQSLFGPFGPTACDGIQYTVRDQRDLSAEIRLASAGATFDWSVGAYYLYIDRQFGLSINEDRNLGVTRTLYNPPGSVMPTTLIFDDLFETDVYAVFGSLQRDVGDNWTVSLALRYDREEREVESQVPNVNDPITGDPINPGLALGPIAPKQRTFTQWQPKLSVLYRVSDTLNVYADWGVGFKAGGFNQQGTQATVDSFFNVPLGLNLQVGDDYDKERTSAFELGMKLESADRRARLSAAAFYTDVTDMQFWEVFTGGFGLVRTVSNIDDVRLVGAELEASWQLADDWSVFGAASYTDSEIRANTTRPNTVGNESPYTADYTVNLGTQWQRPLANGWVLGARLDWRLTGPTWFHAVQDQDNPTLLNLAFGPAGTANYTRTERDAFDVTNVRIDLGGERWTVAAFASNVFDEQIISEVIPAAEFGGAFLAPGHRRTAGVEAEFRF